MTYRMDSDLPAPAGRILHINKELVHVDHKHMIGWNHLEGIQSLSSEGSHFSRETFYLLIVNFYCYTENIGGTKELIVLSDNVATFDINNELKDKGSQLFRLRAR